MIATLVTDLWGFGFGTFSEAGHFNFHLSKQYLHYVTPEHFVIVWSLNVGEKKSSSMGWSGNRYLSPFVTGTCHLLWHQHILHPYTVNFPCCESYLVQVEVLHPIFPDNKTGDMCQAHCSRILLGTEWLEGSSQNLSIVAGSAGVVSTLRNIYITNPVSLLSISSSVSWELFLGLELLISEDKRGHITIKSCVSV